MQISNNSNNFWSEKGSAQIEKQPSFIGGFQVLGNTHEGYQLECSGKFFKKKVDARKAIKAELSC